MGKRAVVFILFFLTQAAFLFSAFNHQSKDEFYSNFSPLIFYPAITCQLPTLDPQGLYTWWELKILLTSSVNYRIQEGKKTYSGNFSFTTSWTGPLEPDEEDFLIYHVNSCFLKWDGAESVNTPDSHEILLTSDFSETPSFHFECILRKEDKYNFDFFVQGILVPQNPSNHKYNLILPATAENSNQAYDISYNSYVKEGSNKVFLDKKSILNRPLKKTFKWSWKHQKWHSEEKRPVYFSQSHETEVIISLKPRNSSSASWDRPAVWKRYSRKNYYLYPDLFKYFCIFLFSPERLRKPHKALCPWVIFIIDPA
ncbi:MAG: hypothetical protein U9O50_05020 [Acidobacteriota bacterium]|nr:hypothetical protein [Acidobacteriota bacterium]